MTKERTEDSPHAFPESDPLVDRFLAIGGTIAFSAALLHGLATAFGPPGASDTAFLFLDLVAALLLGACFGFRDRLSTTAKVLAIAFVVGGLAILSLTRSGFLGSGILLLCTLIVICVATLRPKRSMLVAGLWVTVPPLLSIPVWQGWLQFDPALIERQNSPVGWLFAGLLLLFFTLVSWAVINRLRARLVQEIHSLEASHSELNAANRELEASRDHVAALAYFDSLTGLPNRSHLEEHVAHRLEAGVKTAHLVLLDIRGFRIINALFGSGHGDEILRDVADALRSNLTQWRFAARTGGDEFAVWIEDLEAPDLSSRFDQPFRQTMAHLPVDRGGHRVEHSTASATYPGDAESFEECMKRAGIALRRAKNEQADSLYRFDPAMMQQVEASLRMRNLLEEAITRRDFRMAYQPKVNLRTGEVVGVEALARWSPSTLGPVSPAEFIPEITESKLMIPFGKLILETVLAEIPDVQRQFGDNVSVAVNISPLYFFSRGFAETVIRLAREAGVDPSVLTLEITEDVLLDNISLTRELIQELNDHGVRISLDDFGKGYSSLHYLSYLRVDELKLDSIFVDTICDDERNFALVQCACAMAEVFGFDVVAEGVETAAQAERLRQTACGYAQGYYYGRPTGVQPVR